MEAQEACELSAVAIIGGVLMVCAQVDYVTAIFKNVRPRVLSWFGWAIFMGTGLVAQYMDGVCTMKLLTLACSTLGCIGIGAVALLTERYAYERSDRWFLFAGSVCIGFYLVFDDPWTTSLIGILADLILAKPTLSNAWTHPRAERSRAWLWGMCAWGVTLAWMMGDFSWLAALWPTYLFAFNAAMAGMTYGRRPVA